MTYQVLDAGNLRDATPDEIAEFEAREAEVMQPTVPQEVSIRQSELALLEVELLDDVEELVATLPRQYQSEWRRATVVMRDNGLVEIVRRQKGMTHAEIDQLFITAATL